MSDKIDVIENLIPRVDRLLIGGAMAYTFLKTQDKPVGRSLVEDDKQSAARDILERAKARGLTLLLPVDHVVAPEARADAPTETLGVDDPKIDDRMGLDIGPRTAKGYSDELRDASTVVWNGPMGVFEIDAFAGSATGSRGSRPAAAPRSSFSADARSLASPHCRTNENALHRG